MLRLYENRTLTHNFRSNQRGNPNHKCAATCPELTESGQRLLTPPHLFFWGGGGGGSWLLTQNKPKKANSAPQTNHIRCPAACQPTSSFPCQHPPITAQLKPSMGLPLLLSRSPPHLWALPNSRAGGCYRKLWINSLCFCCCCWYDLHLFPQTV